MSKTPYLARPSLSMREDAKLGNYLNMINTTGEAFGKLYVDEYFSPESKKQMEMYIDYILKSFKDFSIISRHSFI